MAGVVPAAGNGDAPPLAKRRWLRLMLVTASCLICSGVLPGAALFVQLFIDAGIGASKCKNAMPGCDEQQIFVSAAFNSAASVTIAGMLFVGFAFDRLGGNCISQIGAVLVFLGFAMLQIPFLGALYGYDAQTSGWLPWILIITDAGAMLNSFCVYGLTWHFPDYQTFLVTVVNAATSATAVLPNLLSALMNRTGMPLHALFLAWAGFAVLACVICRYLVPTMAEYRTQAKTVLGLPLPRADRQSWCQAVKDAHAVLRQHWGRHLLFVTSCGVAVNIVLVYDSLIGDYGHLIFHSQEAGEKLAGAQNILIAVCSLFLAPSMTFVADKWGSGMQVLMVTAILTCALFALYVATPTWSAQELAALLMAIYFTLYSTLAAKYAIAFASPNRLGVVLGTLTVYIMLVCMLSMAGTYTWIASLPKESLEHLSLPFQGASCVAATGLAIWAAHFTYVGSPAMPVMLAKDEAELSLAFGCANFDEVALATGVKDRQEVLRLLTSTDSKAFKDLLQRADALRAEQAPAAAAAPDAADVEQGPEGAGPLAPPAQLPEEEGAPQELAVAAEGAPAQRTVLEAAPQPGEVTVCALSYRSGGSQSRWAWTSSPLGILFGCCAAEPRRDNLQEVRVPLLTSGSAPLATASDYENKVRALSTKTTDMLSSKDKEGIMHMYETEDPQMLWDSYRHMMDTLSKAELDKVEEEFDELIPQDEFMALSIKRPELRTVFAKMIAYRMKQRAFDW